MPVTAVDSDVIKKTKELCESILNHSEFKELRRNIDSFMADEPAKEQYQALLEKSDHLNHKQQQGVRLSQEEITDYESQRDKVVNNPVSAAFIQAQQEVHEIQESVNRYLSKTFELGRVPNEDELDGGGGCGHGCGCHH